MRVLCSVSPESPLNLTCFSPPVSSALLQLIEEDGRPISASWQQEGVEALVQREMSVSAVSHTPSTHTHTHTHTNTHACLPLKLGLGAEDGKGEPGTQETWQCHTAFRNKSPIQDQQDHSEQG